MWSTPRHPPYAMGFDLNHLRFIGCILVCLIAGCSERSTSADDVGSTATANRGEIPTASESDLAHLDADNIDLIERHVDRVRSQPGDAGAWADLARVYHTNLLYLPALETYAIAGRMAPRDPKVQYQMAIVQERLGRIGEAIATMEALHEWDGRYPPGHRRLADWYRQQGVMDQATLSALKGMELAPRDPGQRLILGEVLADSGEYAKGVKLLKPMLQSPNPHPFVYTLLSRCHRGLGQHELASGMQAFAGPRPEVMADPWFQAVVNKRVGASTDKLRAKGLLNRGEFAKAEQLYRPLRRHLPDDVAIVLNLSRCRLSAGDLDEAQSLIVDYLESHPTNAPAMKRQIALAVHALRSKDAASDDAGWDACDAMVETFVQAHPDDPEGLVFRGEIERSRGRHADAVEWFDRATAVPGLEPGTYINSMVDCLLELNRSDEAIDRLGEVVDSDPSAVDMTIRLARLEAEQDRYESAIERLEFLQQYRPGDPAVRKAINEIGRRDEGD